MRNSRVVPRPGVLATVGGAAATAAEVAAAHVFLCSQLAAACALHGLACVLLGWSLHCLFRPMGEAKGRFWSIFGLLLALFAPPYGMVVIGLLLLSLRFFPPPPGDLLSEFVEHVAPRAVGDASCRRMRAGDIPLVDHLKVEPLIDMLQTDDVDLKRAVIDAMARRRGRKLIACIQGCLQDPRPEIYQYAMARLGRLQEDFTRDIAQATKEIEKAPDQGEPHMQLARVFEQYLESGLVDPTLIDFYQGQLLREYEAVLKANPDETVAALARGRVLIDMKRLDEARCEYERVLARDPANIEARFGMVQVHYASKRWHSMQRELDNILHLAATRMASNPEMVELAQWLRGRTEDRELPAAEHTLAASPEIIPVPAPTATLQVPRTRLQLPGMGGGRSLSCATVAVRSGGGSGKSSGPEASGEAIMAAIMASRNVPPPPPGSPPPLPPQVSSPGGSTQDVVSGWRSRLQKRLSTSQPPREGPQ